MLTCAAKYDTWKLRMRAAMAREGVMYLMCETAEETNYLQNPPKKRTAAYVMFQKDLGMALSMIYDRLSDTYLTRVADCQSPSQIFKVLDNEFKTTTMVGQMTKLSRYQEMKYTGGDMRKYVIAHESRADEVIRSGEQLADNRRVFQLHMSLPVKFDSAMQFYQLLPPESQTYENYRQKLIETAERLHTLERNASSDDQNNRRKDENDKSNGSGDRPKFVRNDTRSNEKPADNGKPENEDKTTKNESYEKSEWRNKDTNRDKKPDWSKFKNAKAADGTTTALTANVAPESEKYVRKIFEERHPTKLGYTLCI